MGRKHQRVCWPQSQAQHRDVCRLRPGLLGDAEQTLGRSWEGPPGARFFFDREESISSATAKCHGSYGLMDIFSNETGGFMGHGRGIE